MIKMGVERILLQGRIWLGGYFKMEARLADETEAPVDSGCLHLYCKTSGGVTKLFYRDDADVEHEIATV